MIKYSVVIPVYNVESYLPYCIDSVLTQNTSFSYEIILVDDGSTDKSSNICDNYASQNSSIRVFHIANQGVSHARNIGIEKSLGEYILFLDADDLWEQDFLKTIEEFIENDPDIIAISCSRLYKNGTKKRFYLPLIPHGENGQKFLNNLFSENKTPLFYAWSYIYRRELIVNNNLFFHENLKVSEDFVQIMNTIPCASSIIGCDQPLYLYRMRDDSATSKISYEKIMNNLTTKAFFFRKYKTASMANIYANNALLITKISKADRPRVAKYLKENRDIWKHVTSMPLIICSVLIFCLGDYSGAVLYEYIRSFAHFLKKLIIHTKKVTDNEYE